MKSTFKTFMVYLTSFTMFYSGLVFADPFEISSSDDDDLPNGSSFSRRCIKMVGGEENWQSIVSGNEGIFKSAVINSIEATFKNAFKTKEDWDENNRNLLITNLKATQLKVKRCAGLAGIMHNTEMGYINDDVKDHYKDFDDADTVRSALGGFECKSDGAETLDFKACRNLARAIDGAVIVEEGVKISQTFQFQNETLDAQAELASKQTITGTEGLEFQKSSVETQADLAEQRTATSIATGATIASLYALMPDKNDIIENCKDFVAGKSFGSQIQEAFKKIALTTLLDRCKEAFRAQDTTGTDVLSAECSAYQSEVNLAETGLFNGSTEGVNKNMCQIAFRKASIFENQDAKIAAERFMLQKGIDIANSTLEKKLLDKQAEQIDGAIQQIDAFAPPEIDFEEQLVQANQCDVDPTAEGCTEAEFQRNVGFQGGDINIGDVARNGTISANGAVDTNFDLPPAEGTNEDDNSGGAGNSLGRSNNPERAGENFVNSAPTAGSLGDPTGAGGGGGGGLNIGGGSTGAKAPVGDNKRAKQVKSATDGKQVTFARGRGSSAPTFKSGSSAKRSKSSKGNPFSSLLGKKKSKKSKNGVVNFRGVASVGKRGDSIFQIISRGYKKAAAKNKLLEYNVK